MSSVEEGSKEKVLPELVDVIGEVFKLGEKKNELITIYNTPSAIKYGALLERKEEGKSYIPIYISKGSCEIYYRNLVKDKNKLTDDFTESISGLHHLLDGLFNILISHNEEPILIAGETSFKTYLAQLSFKDDKNSYETVSLNLSKTTVGTFGKFFKINDFFLKIADKNKPGRNSKLIFMILLSSFFFSLNNKFFKCSIA